MSERHHGHGLGDAGLDAAEVFENLSIGSAPKAETVKPDDYDVLVLCTKNYQPLDESFPGVEVWRVPLVDDPTQKASVEDVRAAVAMGAKVAKAVKSGERVLVTCLQGLNRSAFVAGVAIMILTKCTAKDAVRAMRGARSPEVLRHDVWDHVLERFTSRG